MYSWIWAFIANIWIHYSDNVVILRNAIVLEPDTQSLVHTDDRHTHSMERVNWSNSPKYTVIDNSSW